MLKKEVARSDWFWVLYSKSGKFSLTVTCGQSAVFEIEIKLTKKEEEKYKEQGEKYLNHLAYHVQDDPSYYQNRDNKEL